VKKPGYRYQEAYGGTGAGGYGGHYGGGAAAVQKHGYLQDVYESETESESESDDSDCEEAFPPRGGVQHRHGAYKQQESYQSTVQYTGGGGGGYGTCSPIKNRHLVRYGA
jgi:hypothetical protein